MKLELSLREISYVLNARAPVRVLIMQKLCAVGMQNPGITLIPNRTHIIVTTEAISENNFDKSTPTHSKKFKTATVLKNDTASHQNCFLEKKLHISFVFA